MAKKVSKHELWARIIAYEAVRSTRQLESLHEGTFPSSKSGDYSDVYVVTPYGKIEWADLSRMSDPEMRQFMLEVEKAISEQLKTYDEKGDNEGFLEKLKSTFFNTWGISWDLPEGGPMILKKKKSI